MLNAEQESPLPVSLQKNPVRQLRQSSLFISPLLGLKVPAGQGLMSVLESKSQQGRHLQWHHLKWDQNRNRAWTTEEKYKMFRNAMSISVIIKMVPAMDGDRPKCHPECPPWRVTDRNVTPSARYGGWQTEMSPRVPAMEGDRPKCHPECPPWRATESRMFQRVCEQSHCLTCTPPWRSINGYQSQLAT
jgi:hypothetical protein